MNEARAQPASDFGERQGVDYFHATSYDEEDTGIRGYRKRNALDQRVIMSAPANLPAQSHAVYTDRKITTQSSEDACIISWLASTSDDKITRDYPVVDFVYAVLGFTKEDLITKVAASASRTCLSLPRRPCEKYVEGSYQRGSRKGHSNICLENIFRDLLGQLTNITSSLMADRFSLVALDEHFVCGHLEKAYPDFLGSWAAEGQSRKLDAVAVCGALTKLAAQGASTKIFDTSIHLDRLPDLTYASSARGPSTYLASAARLAPAQPVPVPSERASQKRMKRKAGDADDAEEPETKRQKFIHVATSSHGRQITTCARNKLLNSSEKLRPSDIQIIKHVHDTASHGFRAYSIGFSIDDYTMTLWYMDRLGIVKSASFDFLEEPHFLALFLAAIVFARSQYLGFFPLLRFPSEHIDGTVLGNYRDVVLDLTGAEDMNSEVLEDVRFVVDITDERPLVPTHFAVGRATIVVPVKSHPTSQAAATVCGNTGTVVKISWPFKSRRAEDSYVRAVRTALEAQAPMKKYLKHLVDVKCTLTQSMEQLSLPRARMFGLTKDENLERVCRIIVMREYNTLKLVTSPEELKTIFVGAVRGHRAVYKATRVLHRDISVNNIMFYYEPDGSVVGVLCDWDLAKEVLDSHVTTEVITDDLLMSNLVFLTDVEKSGDVPAASEERADASAPAQSSNKPVIGSAAEDAGSVLGQERRYRTGTGPFMALDILTYGITPQHLYRHDLESFFWMLVWFVATFKPDENDFGWIHEWSLENLSEVGSKKSAALKKTTTVVQTIPNKGSKAYAAAFRPWIASMAITLMKPLLVAQETIESTVQDVWSLGGGVGPATKQQLTDMVWDAVYPQVEARERILTYESFMCSIGEVPEPELCD
ncbi:hypothetical protein EIP91_010988 [Steccherinum ochraceum]|uniref:Fungal-type protein kinase domain-containing protein n=1 Tax=Steccherinum ochraceum TaxID=92696 RepID=A0A4R0RID7_9APHY|nr:hypothetical protein EIP91_010988 [Steccherinum ochraceum]